MYVKLVQCLLFAGIYISKFKKISNMADETNGQKRTKMGRQATLAKRGQLGQIETKSSFGLVRLNLARLACLNWHILPRPLDLLGILGPLTTLAHLSLLYNKIVKIFVRLFMFFLFKF